MQLRKFTPKLRIIVLFIVLFTGISLVPILQIAVQGQVQQQRSPPTPGTIAPPSITPAPPPPQSLGAAGGAASETEGGAASETEGGAASETEGGAASETEGGAAAANQSGLVMIPQSSVMMMINNVQIAIGAVGDDEDAMTALESVDQELRSAATAAGMSVETITDGGGGDIE
jgi:hypothetical protein